MIQRALEKYDVDGIDKEDKDYCLLQVLPDGGKLIQLIQLISSFKVAEHTHTVIQRALEKYDVDGTDKEHKDYCLLQVLPDGGKLIQLIQLISSFKVAEHTHTVIQRALEKNDVDGTDKEDKDYCLLQVLPDGGKLIQLIQVNSSFKVAEHTHTVIQPALEKYDVDGIDKEDKDYCLLQVLPDGGKLIQLIQLISSFKVAEHTHTVIQRALEKYDVDGIDKEDKDYCLLQVLPDGGKLIQLIQLISSFKVAEHTHTVIQRALEKYDVDGTDKEHKDYCLLQVLPDGGKLIQLIQLISSFKVAEHTHTVIQRALEKYDVDGIDKEDKDYCLLQVLPDGGKLIQLIQLISSFKVAEHTHTVIQRALEKYDVDGTDKEHKDYCLLQVLPDGYQVCSIWVAQQVGLRLLPSQTPKTDFLAKRHRAFSGIK